MSKVIEIPLELGKVEDHLPTLPQPAYDPNLLEKDGLMTATSPDLLQGRGKTPHERGANAREKGFSLDEAVAGAQFENIGDVTRGFVGAGRIPTGPTGRRMSLLDFHGKNGFSNVPSPAKTPQPA